jgi:hypothetical protein
MVGCLDNTANGVLLHVSIWFGIELANLLLLSYIPRPVVRNGTLTRPLPSLARNRERFKGKTIGD